MSLVQLDVAHHENDETLQHGYDYCCVCVCVCVFISHCQLAFRNVMGSSASKVLRFRNILCFVLSSVTYMMSNTLEHTCFFVVGT